MLPDCALRSSLWVQGVTRSALRMRSRASSISEKVMSASFGSGELMFRFQSRGERFRGNSVSKSQEQV